MRFTWWTYYIAKRRAFDREYEMFLDYGDIFTGPPYWHNAMEFSLRLRKRAIRERGDRWYTRV